MAKTLVRSSTSKLMIALLSEGRQIRSQNFLAGKMSKNTAIHPLTSFIIQMKYA